MLRINVYNSLFLQYPPGYLEAQAEKEKQAAENKKKGKKRTLSDATNTPEKKKQKVVPFELDEQIEQEITDDGLNKKFWLECKESIPEGKQSFLAKVEELFMCVCCQEVVYLPITTPCSHNICKVRKSARFWDFRFLNHLFCVSTFDFFFILELFEEIILCRNIQLPML